MARKCAINHYTYVSQRLPNQHYYHNVCVLLRMKPWRTYMQTPPPKEYKSWRILNLKAGASQSMCDPQKLQTPHLIISQCLYYHPPSLTHHNNNNCKEKDSGKDIPPNLIFKTIKIIFTHI